MKIVTAEQMRKIDSECIKLGKPVKVLMENAGKAVAEATRDFLGDIKKQNIICLVGGGNNGGDGLVAARYLAGWGAKVVVYLCSPRSAADANLKLVKAKKITCVDAKADKALKKFDALLNGATCVIDGLLGTGKMRPLEGLFKQVLEKVNTAKQERQLKVVAIDLPSGMNADTGALDPACPAADLTVTLAMPKMGLYRFPGAERTGEVIIADIGIPEKLADDVKFELLTPDWAAANLPQRPLNSNKGTFGRVLISAGSINYIGAAYLACSGAARVGAGLVTLATAASLLPIIASKLAEATYLPLPESRPGIVAGAGAEIVHQGCGQYNAYLVGCGLGQNPATVECLSSLLSKENLPPLIIDADALNILSRLPDWSRKIPDDSILTPHPGEMARLTGLTIEEIQSDRAAIALQFATKWQKTIVLKGAFTVIAAQDGRCRISPFANAGLASAGTGDVLAGVIAGIKAQGLDSFDAAALGVYLHAAAGDKIRDELGDTGMIASDLLPALPLVIKQLRSRG
ncbi:MAG: NAD(P)H-hydrate dehydratase [Dehalococcoidales bacterium]|nr:NAD(P)H-hydrate dehydratase [Dehalococcoidales bacterium]